MFRSLGGKTFSLTTTLTNATIKGFKVGLLRMHSIAYISAVVQNYESWYSSNYRDHGVESLPLTGSYLHIPTLSSKRLTVFHIGTSLTSMTSTHKNNPIIQDLYNATCVSMQDLWRNSARWADSKNLCWVTHIAPTTMLRRVLSHAHRLALKLTLILKIETVLLNQNEI